MRVVKSENTEGQIILTWLYEKLCVYSIIDLRITKEQEFICPGHASKVNSKGTAVAWNLLLPLQSQFATVSLRGM